ncbi:MAG: 3-phosphoshikimate 1-carboxyvinyltransferase, partial [Desulfovibrionales bacterium]
MTSIRVPASKSVSHRALIAAALSLGTSRVKAPLKSQDLDRTRECLERLGAVFQEEGEDLIVRGAGSSLDLTRKGTIALPVGESGTTCRLITAVAAAFSGTFHLSGKGRMHERPIRDLTDGLAPLGPRFDFLEREGFPPFLLKSSGLSGGETAVSLEESSQFLSGLLLAAPLAKAGLTLSIAGDKVVSWPYVGITLKTMQEFGVEPVLEVLEDGNWNQKGYHDIATVTPGQVRFRTKPTAYRAKEYTVEGDWSNSSYFLAASALLPEPLAVTGLN